MTTDDVSDVLHGDALSLAYGERIVVDNLSLTLEPGSVTAIVGANACGKSTLLRGLARLLRPCSGAVYLDGESIATLPAREVATRIGILTQSPVVPAGLTVANLVAHGRYPHQRWFSQWSPEDERAVNAALTATKMTELVDRQVDELSGGQRQKAWIAMALAQDTGIMLLDEPTTFLDIAHQIEVLDLLAELNQSQGRTIVLVLHDLNHACRYAARRVAMADGRIVAEGTPAKIINPSLVLAVFNLHCCIIPDPITGTPLVIPYGSHTTNGTTHVASRSEPPAESEPESEGPTRKNDRSGP